MPLRLALMRVCSALFCNSELVGCEYLRVFQYLAILIRSPFNPDEEG
jgi:hypothetical protein